MKRIIRSALSIIGGVILIVGVYRFYTPTIVDSGRYRIAFFVPAIHPSMDDIERGVRHHLSDSTSIIAAITTYNANGNRTLLRAQAEEIVQGHFDAIVTVGAQCSQATHELLIKKQNITPLIFCAVDDPVRLGLVHIPSYRDDATGVLSTSDYRRQLQSLIQIAPTMRRILLVYDPTHGAGLEKDRVILEREAQELGLSFQSVEVMNATDIAQKVPGLLSSTDVVLVLTDHTVVAAIDMLISLCNRYQVVLYTSELNSVDKGAALAFGVTEYEYGVAAAKLVSQMLLEQIKPCEIPAVNMESQIIKINSNTASQQGLILDANRLQSLRDQGAIVL